MGILNNYKDYKQFWPDYSNWTNEQDLENAKRSKYLQNNPQKINQKDIERGKNLLHAIDVMDEYSQSNAEDTEVATQMVMGQVVGLTTFLGTLLGGMSAFLKPVQKVITKISKGSYYMILNKTGLESVVEPKELFANNIIRYVRGMKKTRGSEFKTLYRLVDEKVEAAEFFISKKARYTSKPLKDLKIKKNVLIASIIRKGRVIIPGGLDTIEPLDTVIIVTTDLEIKDVSDILE